MSYLPGFEKNVQDIRLYFYRHDLPKFNRLESLRALRLDPCPICHVSVNISSESICSGHGEYLETIYIRCRSCGLSLRCEDRNSVSIWNRLSFEEEKK